jgi:hypothetical protein
MFSTWDRECALYANFSSGDLQNNSHPGGQRMSHSRTACLLASALVVLGGCSSPDEPASAPRSGTPGEDETETLVARAGAPLFDGMGAYHREIATAPRWRGAAVALANRGNVAGALGERAALNTFRGSPQIDFLVTMAYPPEALPEIADALTASRI